MYELLAFCHEFSAEFLPFLLILVLLRKGQGKYTDKRKKKKILLPILFALYIMAVFSITDVGTLYQIQDFAFEELWYRVNLLPFSREISLRGYILNAVMFVPFGFLLPLLSVQTAKASRTVAGGLAFSVLIEVSQILSLRGTDVDDLIMNTLGAIAGYILYQIWNVLNQGKIQQKTDPRELLCWIGAIYLGRFLLFNRMGLIRWIYGV